MRVEVSVVDYVYGNGAGHVSLLHLSRMDIRTMPESFHCFPTDIADAFSNIKPQTPKDVKQPLLISPE